MKVEYNNQIYRIGNSCYGCSECTLVRNKCLEDIGQCFLSLNEIFVYGSYSPLFEL